MGCNTARACKSVYLKASDMYHSSFREVFPDFVGWGRLGDSCTEHKHCGARK